MYTARIFWRRSVVKLPIYTLIWFRERRVVDNAGHVLKCFSRFFFFLFSDISSNKIKQEFKLIA